MNFRRISRRNFLSTTVATTGTAWLRATSYQNVLGANERVRVGFIGIGLIGKRHLLDFMAQPNVEIAAICEVYEPRLEEGVSTSEGRAERFKDFRRMLDRKNIDAVVVSTPDHWHALMTIMACAAGKDVYVEKPLTHVQREGRWMVEAANRYKRVVQVGTQQRSGKHYQKCVELIRNGHIGELRNVRIGSFRNIMPGFTTAVGTEPLSEEDWQMWLGPAPYTPFDKNRCIYHFRWFWDYSGGQTTNLLSHDLDIVQWAMSSVPRAVAAMGGRYSLKGIGETPDVFEAVLEYSGFLTNWSYRELCASNSSTRDGLEFCGTKGRLVINRRGFEIFPDPLVSAERQIPQFTTARGTDLRPEPEYRTTALRSDGFDQVRDQFQPHALNFLDCIKSRRQPISDLESSHRTVTACHLANISLKVGRTICWDSEKEEIIGDPEASKFMSKEYRSPWDKELKAVLPKLS
jgi:predicted dehydrogenase